MDKLIGAAVIGQSGGPSSVINASAYSILLSTPGGLGPLFKIKKGILCALINLHEILKITFASLSMKMA